MNLLNKPFKKQNRWWWTQFILQELLHGIDWDRYAADTAMFVLKKSGTCFHITLPGQWWRKQHMLSPGDCILEGNNAGTLMIHYHLLYTFTHNRWGQKVVSTIQLITPVDGFIFKNKAFYQMHNLSFLLGGSLSKQNESHLTSFVL